MGVVHLGQSEDGRRAAVKVLRPHIVGDDEARRRLAREVRNLSRVRSERVSEIVDADPHGEVPYVATRYVPGLSLHDYVKQEGVVVGDDLVHLGWCLGQALQAVHDVGVLHRDIKPSNVVMEGRNPILIDFGLARVAEDTNLTQTGWLMGTPGYIAPEVLNGFAPSVAADVHAWAGTVVFAATGRPPFGRGPMMAVLDRVRRGDHDLTGVDHRLLRLLQDCLDPDPAHRPTLPMVAGALDAHRSGAFIAATRRFEEPDWDAPTHRVPPPSSPAAAPMSQPASQPASQSTSPDDLDALWQSLAEPLDQPAFDQPAVDREAPTGAAPWHPMPPLREPYVQPPSPAPWGQPDTAWIPPPPERVPAAERSRRTVLGLAGLGVLSIATWTAPFLTWILVAVAVIVLRAGSLTGTRIRERQAARGRRWYDVVWSPLSAPWFLMASLPSSLILLTWTGLIMGCLLLIVAGFGVSTTVGLPLLGLIGGISLWRGPGGGRLRAPLRRAVAGLSHDPGRWGVAVAVLMVLGGGLAWYAAGPGTVWDPALSRPWPTDGWFASIG